jgi:hypothetical protein
VGKFVGQIIMPKDLSILEKLNAVHEIFEYIIQYVRIARLPSPIFCRGNTVISRGADKVCSTEK